MKKKRIERFYQSSEDIPLILESYEDIFSDFDPRPYSEKALSGDFLSECKKASADKTKKINLKLFIPKSKRNPAEEIKIKKRLKDHFIHHLKKRKNEINKIKLNGFNWFLLGSFMIVLAALFTDYKGSFFMNLLITLTHPAGWFFMWEGLGKIFITVKEKIPDYDFCRKMSEAMISFSNYK